LPVHRVVAVSPGQPIPACSSLQDIVSRVSEQLVVAAITGQLITTRTTANDVVAVEPGDRVVSGQAMDDIIARGAEDRVAVTVPTMVAGSPLHRTGGCTVVPRGEVSTLGAALLERRFGPSGRLFEEVACHP